MIRLEPHRADLVTVGVVGQSCRLLLVFTHVTVYINYAATAVGFIDWTCLVDVIYCTRSRRRSPNLMRLLQLLLHLMLLLRFLNPLRRALNDRIGDSFLHQIDLALPYQLHMRVSQWNQQFLLTLLTKPPLPLLVGGATRSD